MSAFQSTPLIGLPQLTGWSQVAITPDHQLWVAFAVSGQNAGNVGRDVLTWLQSQQPTSTTSVHTLLTQLLGLVRDKACDVQVALAWHNQDRMVFGAVKGSVLLKRHAKVGTLIQSGGEIQLIEGKYQEDDSIVLLTQQASDYLGEIQQKLATGFDIDSIVTGLVPSVHAQADSSLTACVFLSKAKPETVTAMAPEPLISIELLTPDEVPVQETESLTAEPDADATHDPIAILSAPLSQKPTRKSIPNRLIRRLFHGVRGLSRIVMLGIKLMRSQSRRADIRQRLLRILIGIVILSLFLGGGGFWWWRQVTTSQAAAKAALKPWEEQLAQAEQQVASDPLAARQSAAVVVSEVSKIAQEYVKKPGGKKITAAALTNAQARSQIISGQVQKQELPIFYDARLLQSDFVTMIARSQGTAAWLVDTGKKQALILDLSTKKAQIFDLSKMGRITDVAMDGDVVWLLGDGIWKTTVANPTELTQVKPEGDSNRDGKILGAYTTFVYIINPEKRNIYRYAQVKEKENEFSEPIGWLQSSQGVSLKEVTSIGIDGDVWLGTMQGEIKKLTSGSPVDFTIQGLNAPFTGSVWLVTNQNLTNVYVLEPSASRVVILRKDGTFLKELSSPMLKTSTGLLIDETVNRAYAVSGSLLFELEL